MTAPTIPISIDDPVNRQILAVSEDRIQGFHRRPFAKITQDTALDIDTVIERIRAMLDAGTIRRVRQTLLATSLAPGALVAWQVPPDRLDDAFNYMSKQDPFSGHVVIRTADPASPGANYRLWTTLKVPQGYDMDAHCRFLTWQTGAEHYRLMPACCLFTLGVGHVRRSALEPGSKSDQPADVTETNVTHLDDDQWRVLVAIKREFTTEEIQPDPWQPRATEIGLTIDEFCNAAQDLNQRGVVGRFSTFLEHVKPLADGKRVTRFNALFHWAVPPGREIEAGREVGRHHILTHAYWREAGPEFRNVNIMAVAHSTDKDLLLRHKDAIDQHLAAVGIPVAYTNVFWGGRSEIKPSEIAPNAYKQWAQSVGLSIKPPNSDPDT